MSIRALFSGIARLFAFLRVTLANMLVLLVLLLVAAIFIGIAAGPSRPLVDEGSALLVAPKGIVVEQQSADPMLLLAGELGQADVGDLLRGVERAAEDDRVAALVLDLTSTAFSAPAQLEVLGEAVAAFRERGKMVVAKGDYYNRDQFYLASFADEIYMHPMGEVTLGGYALYGDYFQGLLETLDVNVHVFRVGTYKAAVEPYTRRDMSPEAKAANQALVDGLWERYAAQVGANRGLSPEAIVAYADRFDEFLAAADGNTAQAALEYGLVDALLTKEQIAERLRELVGEAESASTDAPDFRHVALDDYLQPRPPLVFGDTVAVLTATGNILMGKQPRGAIGATNVAKLLRQAREDDAVKALVLRIHSGGGSAFASEIIRLEIERVRELGKPVVASMAGVAASGGYWIAADADEIWAAPTTLTGSIGIFGIVPTFEDTLGSAGVTRDGVVSGPFANALDPFVGLSDGMARALQSTVDHGYRQFLRVVANGREMTTEQVDAVGQGRVWSGAKAQELGLVDKLGHLDDAIASAATLAGIENYRVRHLEEPLPPWQATLQTALEEYGAQPLPSPALAGKAKTLLRSLGQMRALNDPKHVYALCGACDTTF